jgi:amidase
MGAISGIVVAAVIWRCGGKGASAVNPVSFEDVRSALMPSVQVDDPVGALVPHTLQEPIPGASSGPLAGLSFMVKDLFAIKGRKAGCGNPDWYAAAAPVTATAPAIQRLLDAGASLTGITICDEFFYSVLGTNIHYGAPLNAKSPDHVTGGSSCGSAAAVAAGMCDFALGSDTGGSVRVPASFCGLYGLRPTHDRIEMTGVTPMAPSYDTVGFLARDAELFRDVGRVLLDGHRVEAPLQRIIVAQDMFARSESSIDDALWQMLDAIVGALPRHERMDVAGEDYDAWRDAFRFIQGFEIQSTLLPFALAHAKGLAPAIRERVEIAARVTESEAKTGRDIRGAAHKRLRALAEPGTMILLPTTPTLPPQRDIPDGASTMEFRAQTLGSTCLAGHAGLPQISIPGAIAAGCPAGLSFIGWKGGDEALLDLAVRLAPLLGRKP